MAEFEPLYMILAVFYFFNPGDFPLVFVLVVTLDESKN